MTLLHINSSPFGEASVSRQLTREIVAVARAADPALEVVYRDLAADPPDHLTAELMQVVKFGQSDGLSQRQQQERALIDSILAEFLAADTVVIGAPMYNFSVPTQLKGWLDRLCQAGRTFKYTDQGPVGLAGGRRVILASARGGRYAGTPAETRLDHQEAYLRAVLGFVGVTEVEIVRAEGVSMGAEARAAALSAAQQQIAQLWPAGGAR